MTNILFPGTQDDWDEVWEHVEYLNTSYDYTLDYVPPPPFQVPQAETPSFSCGINKPGPPPGDPDLSHGTITAYSSKYGIQLHWTYPQNKPELVSFSQVYKSTGPYFEYANELVKVSGSSFVDILNDEELRDIRYYYWVRHVSINGTWGTPIGPADSTWKGSLDDILDYLQGLIDVSFLDDHLREQISSIVDFTSGLSKEVQDRLLGDGYLNMLIGKLDNELKAIDTRVDEEVFEIQNEHLAFAAKVERVLAKFNTSIAAVQVETLALATADKAVAGQVTTLQSVLLKPNHTEDDEDPYIDVKLQQQMITYIDADMKNVYDLGNVYNSKGELVRVRNLADRIADMYAQYSLKLDVQGHISGFGLRSDEEYSEFIVNANTFAIGPPENEKFYDSEGNPPTQVNPFIVTQQWIDGKYESTIGMNADVFIKQGTIKNAMIDNVIHSTEWNPEPDPETGKEFTGWMIDKEGKAFFEDITARGDIQARSIEAGAVNIIDTLMLEGDAVILPQGSRQTKSKEVYPGDWDILTALTLRWDNPDHTPKAFIIHGAFMFNGTNLVGDDPNPDGNWAGQGTGVIGIFIEWITISGNYTQQKVNTFANSIQYGFGCIMNGMWHRSCPHSDALGVKVSLAANIKDSSNYDGNPNPARRAHGGALSVMGAKR